MLPGWTHAVGPSTCKHLLHLVIISNLHAIVSVTVCGWECFLRTIRLPAAADLTKVQAKLDQGVLQLDVDKKKVCGRAAFQKRTTGMVYECISLLLSLTPGVALRAGARPQGHRCQVIGWCADERTAR